MSRFVSPAATWAHSGKSTLFAHQVSIVGRRIDLLFRNLEVLILWRKSQLPYLWAL